jgi:arylsulfatase A-like enzyme
MSDHGEYLGDHGLYLKGAPAFQGGYHIPFIMRWPDGINNPGRQVNAFINLADFAPTFLDLAGIDEQPEMSGRSIVPFLSDDNPADWRDEHFTQFNGVELYYTQRSIKTVEFKYVYNGFDFDELYDLRRDPNEMVNVADDPAYDEIKQDLVRRMWVRAAEEEDTIFNPYGTVGLAPWGPADALAS